MNIRRSRAVYATFIFIVIFLGLASRRFSGFIPDFVDTYLGDALWALMIYFIIGFLFKNMPIKKTAAFAAIFCHAIETSQLYHSNWIDAIRSTTVGGLVLGYGFLWSDIIAYSMGVCIGALTEVIFKADKSK
ncbi:Protein of unknown function [Peptoclostridium litorale DSM 5388]|uniref:DUF2809 domain-containing protein n=2 Tax=Peptoclostridium litorale TaxID=1557 RepID=A0A069RG36_PEPLI|nr:DUF2809 domain-containing protein [Peptoclostridium litorale]KDR95115.1 hypothetical protein CLIT_11c01440 [Peptoclostridium litorale DSM 5388]SIN74777.1 Protein of unknown function [Peptoclostridium litorale DSM 5388]